MCSLNDLVALASGETLVALACGETPNDLPLAAHYITDERELDSVVDEDENDEDDEEEEGEGDK